MSDFSLARRAMVDSQLRPQGVTDKAVLAAMSAVERERFVPEAQRALAYFDRTVPLGDGRSMMPPAALGRLLSEAAPKAGERALIIGSAGGYAEAVLTAIGLDVTTGDAKGGPFDLILVDGAVEELPDTVLSRLNENGRVALALSDRGVTRLAIGRLSGGSLGYQVIVDADVPMIPGFEKPRAFTF